jgi:hypothetical protein
VAPVEQEEAVDLEDKIIQFEKNILQISRFIYGD